ncbi:MAG: indolepyruvate ferredoxin oxidoreductase subunit alpha [Candidatus Aenigmarchaeota archaeon]|nr:indolepyruvate ferredoxin oxidoreductase subunit alpha [Candidatus Aenigmarchaeota archaeon]
MVRELLSPEVGKKLILLGNEAIVRGSLEAGVRFVSTYPGTPASEIGDRFAVIAKEAGIYFEYSTNEKVAMEAAAGASFAGLKSLVAMKHFGINVASDSLLPIAYVGTRGGMVVIVADDPSGWSSAQSEQDSRYYPRMGHIPLLEPSNPQECKEVTKFAFELSKQFEIPVIIRTTTRVAHTRSPVTFGQITKIDGKGRFIKDLERYNTLPPNVIALHEKIVEKNEKIRDFFEQSELNFIVNKKKSKFGIITSGVSFNYVVDALDELGIKIPVLKLTTTHPLPRKKIIDFLKLLKSVLIVEELEPVLEKDIKVIAQEEKLKIEIRGKNLVPRAGELTPEKVLLAISKFLNKKPSFNFDLHLKKFKRVDVSRRFPVMCPGCPYRPAFYAVKEAAGEEVVLGGDIGCYMLGIFPPANAADFILNMGAGEGVIHGINKASDQKTIAFIGDSTFFHAGIPALMNMVFNKSNPLVIILDNLTTAMTGHQPHPGTGITGIGEKTRTIVIEDMVKACGANVKVVDPYNIQEMISAVKESLKSKETSVIVARRECRLLFLRKAKKADIKLNKFQINPKRCNKCGICLERFGCPAIYKDEKGFYINEELCNGCGVCSQICPSKAIEVKK